MATVSRGSDLTYLASPDEPRDELTADELHFLEAMRDLHRPSSGHGMARRHFYSSEGVLYGPGFPPEGYKNPYGRGKPRTFRPLQNEGHLPPVDGRGEYRIRDTSGTIIRLGISFSLRRRMQEYIRDGLIQPGYSFEYQIASASARRADILYHEGLKLSEHRPSRNVRKIDW